MSTCRPALLSEANAVAKLIVYLPLYDVFGFPSLKTMVRSPEHACVTPELTLPPPVPFAARIAMRKYVQPQQSL
jgi:hypothetical protein